MTSQDPPASPPFFLVARSRTRRARPMQLSLRARRNPPSPRRTSNLFRRQSAAKPLGFDPDSASLPRNTPLDLFLLHVRLFRSKAAPRETMAPVCQEASGSRHPFVKGITSPPRNIKIPTYLRRAWHHHRFLRAIPLLSRHSLHPFPSSARNNGTEHSAFRGFFQPRPAVHTRLNTREAAFVEWNAMVQWRGALQPRVDHEIHSPAIHSGYG